MTSWAQKMVCPKCGTLTNCRSVSGKHDLAAAGLAPEYATKRAIGGKDFNVYKRVRECAACGGQFTAYEITDRVLEQIIEHVAGSETTPETLLGKFKAELIAMIMEMKLPESD